MFNTFAAPPTDMILALAIAFRQDPRPHKIDLGIGVYKDASGATPVMRAVKAAEKAVWETEATKAYIGLGGDEAFAGHIENLVLGESIDSSRTRSIQTVGGGAAIRLLCEVLVEGGAENIWVPDPTWINHVPIAQATGLNVHKYPYLDRATSRVAFSEMMTELSKVPEGNVILLHGCCHNPTGADLTRNEWDEVAELLSRRKLLPFVDVAYQGFGDGLEQDALGVRKIAASVPEMVISASCSKNFGVYRDRAGIASIIAGTSADADKGKATLLAKGRVNYSFPANHAAATIATIFESSQLFAEWQSELEDMRLRMVENRHALANGLKLATNSDRFEFIRDHKGMFSLLGVDASAIERLKEEHAIFMPPDGRMNLAAVKESDIELISNSIASVI